MIAAQRETEERARALDALRVIRQAHADLLAELDNMERVQSAPAPTAEQWANARWKLSRASRTRRNLMESTYALALAAATSPLERDRVDHLRGQDAAMLARSRDHIARWTPDRIEADWAGYCAASRAMRASMAQRVRAEQDILLPLLARLAQD